MPQDTKPTVKKTKVRRNPEYALELFKKGMTQKFIADLFGCEENTITEWKKKYKWEEKYREMVQPTLVLETNLLRIANHNVRCDCAEIDRQEAAGELTPIAGKNLDAISKVLSKIKFDKVSAAEKVVIMEGFINFLRADNPELAKTITESVMEYCRTFGSILNHG